MTQRDRVLAMLEEAGPTGVTNGEFVSHHILRYSARVEELRKEGAEIACERVSGGTYVYKLASTEPGGLVTRSGPAEDAQGAGDQRGGGRAPGSSSLAEVAPAPANTCVCRELDGTWREIPTPKWALAGGAG